MVEDVDFFSGFDTASDRGGKRLVLVTVHRREVFGEAIREMFYALRDLAGAVPDVLILFPVHLNPRVRNPAQEILGSSANIVLTEPFDYFSFVHAMSRAHLILTDSGGIQEEAPTLGVPVLCCGTRRSVRKD